MLESVNMQPTPAVIDASQQNGLHMAPPLDRSVSDTLIDFTRLYSMLFNTLDMQTSIADTKAQLIITANTIMVASVAFDRNMLVNALGPNASAVHQFSLVVTLVMATALMLSIYYALRSSRPNMRSPRAGNVQATRNPFFFGHIAQMDENAFVDAFMGQTMQDVKLNVAQQIHAKSVVVNRKFRAIASSMNFLFVALGSWLLARLILALA
jgi:hypothetical protein